MRTRLFFYLLVLAAAALPTHAASLSLSPLQIPTGTSAVISVDADLGSESINALEGHIVLPDGLAFESVDTTGSALSLFVNSPTYVVGEHSVEFTGGATKAFTGTVHLFSLHIHADNPGTYVLTPSEVFAYRADGKGTRLTVVASPATLDATAGAPTIHATVPRAPVSALEAEIGSDPALYGGKKFVALFGGDDGSGITGYEVREGWWGSADHRSPTAPYHVLKDQTQKNSIYITAIRKDGTVATTVIPGTQPFVERAILMLALLVLAGCVFLLARKFF